MIRRGINFRTRVTFSSASSFNMLAPEMYSKNADNLPYCPVRLETHYYSNILPDLLLLNYDHHSPEATFEHVNKLFSQNPTASSFEKATRNDKLSREERHQLQIQQPPPYLKLPDEPLKYFFSKEIDKLITETTTAGEITTNLITTVNSRAVNKLPTRKWNKLIYNPIDYTTVKRDVLLDKKSKPTPLPYSPLPSRLPFIRKIVLKVWNESAVGNKSIILSAVMSLSAITGHRASPLFADRADNTKKIREGMPLGARVELTGKSMFDFLDKLIQTVLPRMREWEGLSPEGDGAGSFTLSLPSAAVGYFPDIEPHFDMYPQLFDTEIIIHTTGRTDEEAVTLLTGFGIPFKERVPLKVFTKSDTKDPFAKFKKKGDKRDKK